MGKFMKLFKKSIYFLCAILLAALVTLMFINVVSRNLFDHSLPAAPEVSIILAIWMVTLGTIIAFLEAEHLGVNLLMKKLPEKGRWIAFIASQLIIAVVCVFMFIGSYKLTMLNIHSVKPATGLPMVLVYGAGLVLSAGIIIGVLVNLIRLFIEKDVNRLIEPASNSSSDTESR